MGRGAGGGGRAGRAAAGVSNPASTTEQAIEILGLDERNVDTDRALAGDEARWLQGTDWEAKTDIVEWYRLNPELKTARLYLLYSTEGRAGQSFENFLDTPMTFYRGGTPTFGNTFATFSTSMGAAEHFERAGGGLFSVAIRPRDLVGYAPTGAGEAFVPPEDSRWNPVEVTQVR